MYWDDESIIRAHKTNGEYQLQLKKKHILFGLQSSLSIRNLDFRVSHLHEFTVQSLQHSWSDRYDTSTKDPEKGEHRPN